MWAAENRYTYLPILQNTSCIIKRRSSKGGGGAHPLHPPPRSTQFKGEFANAFADTQLSQFP